MPPAPLALTDEQLASVMALCRQLQPSSRSAYLETLAARLRNIADLGDGVLHRIATLTAREVLARDGLGHWSGTGDDPED